MDKKYTDLDLRLALRIYNDLKKLNHRFSEPKIDRWADDIRMIRQTKKVDHLFIFAVWQWAHNDDFWKLNILSPGKLRKQFDQLVIRKEADEIKKKLTAEKERPKISRVPVSDQCAACGNPTPPDQMMIGNVCLKCYKSTKLTSNPTPSDAGNTPLSGILNTIVRKDSK